MSREEAIAGKMETVETRRSSAGTISISIGIIAWNEEKAIKPALESLFHQSFLGEMDRRSCRCEIICLANGCTDRTAAVATDIFADESRRHPFRDDFSCRTVELQERGKINAWNRFVHDFSAPEAEFLFLMDADILIHGPETLSNMIAALEENPSACIATDQPCKSVLFKSRKTLADRLSLHASGMTRASEAQLCGQLYCIRSEIARRIYLPRDLSACEDGFIKALVCTDFLTRPTNPDRIVLADDARHTFEPYTSIPRILKNQKRQMIGQTIVHILVDDYLQTLPVSARLNLAKTLQEKERTDPNWLKRLIRIHLRKTRFFWRLIPGIATFRFRRLARIRGMQKLIYLPVATAGFFISMISCFRAFAFLRRGHVAYWPHARVPNAK